MNVFAVNDSGIKHSIVNHYAADKKRPASEEESVAIPVAAEPIGQTIVI